MTVKKGNYNQYVSDLKAETTSFSPSLGDRSYMAEGSNQRNTHVQARITQTELGIDFESTGRSRDFEIDGFEAVDRAGVYMY